MTTIEERSEYLNNPYKTAAIYGNFSPFYVTIGICSVLLAAIIVLNIVIGCCSRHKQYWQDRHTGNRWLVSIWSATPHQQPPLDLTELKDVSVFQPVRSTDEHEYVVSHHRPADEPRGYGRTQYWQQQHHQHQLQHHQQSLHQQQQQPLQHHQHHQQPQEEYVEFHKRESDI